MSVEIKVPEMGESITEATIANWVKKEGESVKQDEILLELETDKATMEVPAPSSGVLQKIHKKAGETVKVKEIIGLIDSSATASSPSPSASAPTNSAQTTQTSGNGTINETLPPAVRKLIEDNGLNPASITGSGKNGQITKEDVLKAIETKATSSVSNASVNVGTPAAVKATLTLPEIPKAVPAARRTDLPRENVVL
ncbi:Dihydrolipoyllysine-residue succinyltransferase component of 2-oxoglutarate dehydrogenase complex [Leptospira interrogans]|nr:Dihydrolipoyllysine-residue succinyltransferase component of 2-oxoglutarate dehydrogenase complex [Leptospira interrogans]